MLSKLFRPGIMRNVRTLSQSAEEMLLPGDSISAYRYFQPIQTRVADVGGLYASEMFYFYADVIANTYLTWQCGFGREKKYRRLMVHTESNFRSATHYPEVLLAGMRVDKLGKSSVQYGIAIYAPKLDYFSCVPSEKPDILSELGISLHGLVVNDSESDIFHKMSEHYHDKPSMFGHLVHVYCDENDKPVQRLPDGVRDGMARILVASTPKL